MVAFVVEKNFKTAIKSFREFHCIFILCLLSSKKCLFAAVSQLSSPNDWTNTEDYTCNFDSGKGKCLWDIQGKSTLVDPDMEAPSSTLKNLH